MIWEFHLVGTLNAFPVSDSNEHHAFAVRRCHNSVTLVPFVIANSSVVVLAHLLINGLDRRIQFT